MSTRQMGCASHLSQMKVGGTNLSGQHKFSVSYLLAVAERQRTGRGRGYPYPQVSYYFTRYTQFSTRMSLDLSFGTCLYNSYCMAFSTKFYSSTTSSLVDVQLCSQHPQCWRKGLNWVMYYGYGYWCCSSNVESLPLFMYLMNKPNHFLVLWLCTRTLWSIEMQVACFCSLTFYSQDQKKNIHML